MRNKDIKKEVYKRAWKIINSLKNVKEDFQAPSIGILVGHHGYPMVNSGILSSFGYNPKGSSVMELLVERAKILNSKRRTNVRKSMNVKEIVLSERPVETEVKLKRKPTIKINVNKFTRPVMVQAKLERFKVVENPKIKHSVEKIIDDEMSAEEGVVKLYKHEDVDKISTIFSAGLLGRNKKLVPTRWSITATDDILSKHLIEEIKDFKQVENFYLFHGKYLENEFLIMVYPSPWAFEMIESWGAKPSIDYEFFHGRKTYASDIEGAYYAARLAVAEYLKKIKRQAACSVLRLVHRGYFAPLGVWVIREGVRNVLKQRVEFSSLSDMISFAGEMYPWSLKFLKKSRVVPFLSQKSLKHYLR